MNNTNQFIQISFYSEKYDNIYHIWKYQENDAIAKFNALKAKCNNSNESLGWVIDLRSVKDNQINDSFIPDIAFIERTIGKSVDSEDAMENQFQSSCADLFRNES